MKNYNDKEFNTIIKSTEQIIDTWNDLDNNISENDMLNQLSYLVDEVQQYNNNTQFNKTIIPLEE